jgi:hypothetical protein
MCVAFSGWMPSQGGCLLRVDAFSGWVPERVLAKQKPTNFHEAFRHSGIEPARTDSNVCNLKHGCGWDGGEWRHTCI